MSTTDITVMKFFAPWCMPCRVYAKTFKRATEDLAVQTREVNVDTEPELTETFNVTSIPTTIVVVDGREVSRHVGPMLHRDLTAMIQTAEGASV